MNLRAGFPFWLVKDGLPFTFPKLDHDLKTDVLVIGAGISGALMRYYLREAGISCVTVDARTIGLGSTCASTALLQYEIDVPLHELIAMRGKEQAERAFQLCGNAIDDLESIAANVKFQEFARNDSLYVADRPSKKKFLEREFEARKAAGFDVALLNEGEISRDYGFQAPMAIRSSLAAQTDVYAFVHRLLQHKREGDDIFDRTRIVGRKDDRQGVTLITGEGQKIRAGKVVYATGYEVTEIISKPIVKLLSTYAIISEQFNNMPMRSDTLFWNTADPYLYMRTTPDKRILIGGRDENFSDPGRRDKLIRTKMRWLEHDFRKWFPEIPFTTEFAWAGTFGSTADGLPYIGTYEPFPNSFFALGFGGNGITFSVIAAKIITEMILKKQSDDAQLFAFDR